MCGFAGIVSRRKEAPANGLTAAVGSMAEAMQCRGPDDSGEWADADAGVALGHRRLAIIDPSPAGRQPMVSSSGRYVLVTNGEIYNFPELRQQLEADGASFRGHSDTEVMLAAIDAWGLAAALARWNGMFAFALWDRTERCLTLGRDRMGIKPLVYGWQEDVFLFGSELRGVRAHPAFAAPIDREAQALFLRRGSVPAPYTIHGGIRKLPAGSLLHLSADHAKAGTLPEPEAYWSLRSVLENAAPVQADEAALQEELETLLKDAVRLRLVSDRPLGAWLSGGIDSSLVTALMQEQTETVRTFTVAFDDERLDESPYARRVAEHLGTAHTAFALAAKDALDVVPRLAEIYDEPFGDASQIPTCLLAAHARAHVTVAVAGDGGDELFGGYPRHARGIRTWQRLQRLPMALRRACRAGLGIVPLEGWESVFSLLGGRLPELRHRSAGDVIPRAKRMLEATTPETLYSAFMDHWSTPPLTEVSLPLAPVTAAAASSASADPLRWMMVQDAIGYLPDDLLTKVDRASMHVGLEVRVPLLDHRVVEFAARLPTGMLTDGRQGKRPLRRLLDGRVPAALTRRPKKGFGVPLADWLRGPLRDWAEPFLETRRLEAEGFDAAMVQATWREHQNGSQDHKYALWDVIMFQAWKAAWSG